MIGNKNTETRLTITAVVFLLAFVIGNGCYRSISRKNKLDKRNRAGGQQIVRALEQYHNDKSAYPVELKLLEPEYLKPVPLVRMRENDSGRPFHYEVVDGGKHFKLLYDEAPITMSPADAAFEYESRTGAWHHKLY